MSAANTPAAVLEFDRAVQDHEKRGLARAAAVRAVVHANPDLHRRYVEAVNAAGTSRPAAKAPPAAVLEYECAIENYVGRGLTREAALRAVAKADPGLHQRFLQAVNAASPHAIETIQRRFAAS